MTSLFKTIKWYAKAISQQTVIYGVGRLSRNAVFNRYAPFFSHTMYEDNCSRKTSRKFTLPESQRVLEIRGWYLMGYDCLYDIG